MKRLERITRLIFVFILIYALLFAVTAFAAPSAEGETFSATASNLASQLSETSNGASKPVNILGVICWAVIILGILFILYVLFVSGKKKKSGMRPKQQMKYRRSPYKKGHRHMQDEYYRYKRNKYK